MFEKAKKTLDFMPLLIEMLIVGSLLYAVSSGRNVGEEAIFFTKASNGITIVALIGQ